MKCPDCNGTGIVTIEEPGWKIALYTFPHIETISCEACDGTGEYRDDEPDDEHGNTNEDYFPDSLQWREGEDS